MIWFVSNLNGTSISLFLFGEAYDARWKESEGTIIAILNPKRKEDKPGSSQSSLEQRGPAYTVSNPGQVLVIGRVSSLFNLRRIRKMTVCIYASVTCFPAICGHKQMFGALSSLHRLLADICTLTHTPTNMFVHMLFMSTLHMSIYTYISLGGVLQICSRFFHLRHTCNMLTRTNHLARGFACLRTSRASYTCIHTTFLRTCISY
jgi:hypothetical protein